MLVRDDTYPPRPLIRSKKVDDPDADENDSEVALDCGDTAESRCRGSGGASRRSMYDDGPPLGSGIRLAIGRFGCTERDLALGVGASAGVPR